MLKNLLLILFLFTCTFSHSQICDSPVPQIMVDLSESPTGEFVIGGANLNGDCCGSENLSGNVNCVEFIVIPHPNSFSFSFNLSGGLGNGTLYLDCGEEVTDNENFCVFGADQFSLIFCKPGSNPISGLVISAYGLPDYSFDDIIVEETCSVVITSENFSITSINPNTIGFYDNLLSCTNVCDEVIIDTSLLDEYVEYIDFQITPVYTEFIGNVDFNCDGSINSSDLAILLGQFENNIDTIRINIIPKVELNVFSGCDFFSYTVNGGTEPYTFILNGENVDEIIPVEGLNTLIVESSLCSSDTVEFEWYESKPPIEVFHDEDYICLGSVATFTTFSEETLIWNFGDGTEFIGIGNVSHVYSLPGEFIITIAYLNTNVCDSTISLPFNVIEPPILSVFSSCDEFSYSITGNEPYIVNLNGEVVNEIIPVEGPNILFVESLLCTSNIVEFEWYESKPPIEVFHNTDICLGEEIFFTTSSEETLIWNFGDGNEFIGIGNITHQYVSSGDFLVNVSYLESNICDIDTEINVKVYETPSINANVFPNEGCAPLNINLFSEFNSEYTYTWDLGFTTSNLNELLFTLNEPSNYTIEHIVSNENCNSDTLFFVSVYNTPISNFTIDPNIINEDEIFMVNIENNSQFSDFYLWEFGETTMTTFEPNIEELSPGEYNVSLTVTNSFACSDISYGKLIIKPLFTFYVPNAITPNGDGVNDLFYGEGIGIKNYEMSIYNRWGEKIFYTDSKENKWNGGVSEWYVQNDVYLYVFKITDIMGKIHLIKGHVTVIR